ncbi:RNA polymerase sigma factor, sigma-70 family protein [Desulfosporosinus sp. OT]|nr:RNA polymerase sigma factor, sigma-70 family protein [Desulfosporosinus sp. OT]
MQDDNKNADINLEIFEIITKQNYKKVYQTVYSYTNNKHISEDAVQQAFVIAYKQINQLKFKDKFASWVITIALNEAKRMLKDKNNSKITSLTDFHLNILQESKETDVELKEDIDNALSKLKHNETEILVLKYYADLTLQQISDLLGINLSNTKVRLHRAKVKFRKLIDKDFNQYTGG